MRIAETKKFEPCPEYTGRAVCVDVTPLQKRMTDYGEKEVFQFVFEVDIPRAEGGRFTVRSRRFTPILSPSSNLRRFMQGWLGRELTVEELKGIETEELVNRPAHLVVVHEHKGGETYANIVACKADSGTDPLEPSGKYVRVKDREIGKGNGPSISNSGSAPRPVEDLSRTKVHVGRCTGLEVRELTAEQAQPIIEKWLPGAKANPTATADDKKLIAGLEWWIKSQMTGGDDIAF